MWGQGREPGEDGAGVVVFSGLLWPEEMKEEELLSLLNSGFQRGSESGLGMELSQNE